MSDYSHDAPDGRDVPVSAGTPREIQILLMLAVLIVFMQGAFVVFSSGFGKVWPAESSVKIPLPPGI